MTAKRLTVADSVLALLAKLRTRHRTLAGPNGARCWHQTETKTAFAVFLHLHVSKVAWTQVQYQRESPGFVTGGILRQNAQQLLGIVHSLISVISQQPTHQHQVVQPKRISHARLVQQQLNVTRYTLRDPAVKRCIDFAAALPVRHAPGAASQRKGSWFRMRRCSRVVTCFQPDLGEKTRFQTN